MCFSSPRKVLASATAGMPFSSFCLQMTERWTKSFKKPRGTDKWPIRLLTGHSQRTGLTKGCYLPVQRSESTLLHLRICYESVGFWSMTTSTEFYYAMHVNRMRQTHCSHNRSVTTNHAFSCGKTDWFKTKSTFFLVCPTLVQWWTLNLSHFTIKLNLSSFQYRTTFRHCRS